MGEDNILYRHFIGGYVLFCLVATSVLVGLRKGGHHDYYSDVGLRIAFSYSYRDSDFNYLEKFEKHKKIDPPLK